MKRLFVLMLALTVLISCSTAMPETQESEETHPVDLPAIGELEPLAGTTIDIDGFTQVPLTEDAWLESVESVWSEDMFQHPITYDMGGADFDTRAYSLPAYSSASPDNQYFAMLCMQYDEEYVRTGGDDGNALYWVELYSRDGTWEKIYEQLYENESARIRQAKIVWLDSTKILLDSYMVIYDILTGEIVELDYPLGDINDMSKRFNFQYYTFSVSPSPSGQYFVCMIRGYWTGYIFLYDIASAEWKQIICEPDEPNDLTSGEIDPENLPDYDSFVFYWDDDTLHILQTAWDLAQNIAVTTGVYRYSPETDETEYLCEVTPVPAASFTGSPYCLIEEEDAVRIYHYVTGECIDVNGLKIGEGQFVDFFATSPSVILVGDHDNHICHIYDLTARQEYIITSDWVTSFYLGTDGFFHFRAREDERIIK